MLYRLAKGFFIFVRHGINPFRSVSDSKEKVRKRFTEKEKQWFIKNSRGSTRERIIKILYGDE